MAKKVKGSILPGGKLNNFLNNFPDTILNYRPSKRVYLILLVVGILLLGIYKKSWFIAATVNGMPVTNLELQQKLNQQFKTQTLNQMINEKIILDEARKNNAIVSGSEIDKKISDLEANVGGKASLDSLLSQQGQTRIALREQLLIQLSIAKLYGSEATVSADEVSKFIEQNKQSLPSYNGKDQLTASESAKLEKEATDTIKQQKLSQIFSQKFQDLRSKAKIQIF